MSQDKDYQGIRLSGGRTESGGRIKWCTALDAVLIQARDKSRESCAMGYGKRWVDHWNRMMPETPKTLGALASRYRKIIGTELMVKATRLLEKPEPSNVPQETADQDPKQTEALVESIKDELREQFLSVRSEIGEFSERVRPYLKGKLVRQKKLQAIDELVTEEYSVGNSHSGDSTALCTQEQ